MSYFDDDVPRAPHPSLLEEEKGRGVVVRLDSPTRTGIGIGIEFPEIRKVDVRLGPLNKVERKTLAGQRGESAVANVTIHADGSVTIHTFRYATNIPVEELEALARLARAAADGELPVEIPPAGKTGPTENEEIPF
jgi:hypothetical protein